MNSREDLKDSDILQFQWHCDLFFSNWLEAAGRDGVTNYIHALAAGHFADYLYRWRNLYQHSQQGFECWNKLFKRYFIYRTQRGGSSGRNNEGIRTRLLPLARWIQRRYVYMTGVTLEEMKAALKEWKQEEHNDDVIVAGPGEKDWIEPEPAEGWI